MNKAFRPSSLLTVSILFLLVAFWYSSDEPAFNDLSDPSQFREQAKADELSIPEASSRRSTGNPSANSSRSAIARQTQIDNLVEPLYPQHRQLLLSVADEVIADFSDFLDGFSNSEQRTVADALTKAYTDIQLVGLAAEMENLSEDELATLANPNHVLEVMSSQLSTQKLTELENFLEERARKRFDLASESSISALAAELEPQSREQLLDTLFTQTYLLVNPDGIGSRANLGLRANEQLRAINNTREALRHSLSEEELILVEAYLQERETATATMGFIFDSGAGANGQ